jgi:hypothetical protein
MGDEMHGRFPYVLESGEGSGSSPFIEGSYPMPYDVSVCAPEDIERGTVFMREIAEAKRSEERKQFTDTEEPPETDLTVLKKNPDGATCRTRSGN